MRLSRVTWLLLPGVGLTLAFFGLAFGQQIHRNAFEGHEPVWVKGPTDAKVREIAHRVTDLRPVPGGLLISTKGDANSAADLWNPFLLHGPYIYRAQFSLPLVGYVGIAVHSHTAQLLLFSGGGVLALLALIGMFIPNRKQPAEAGEAVA